MVLTVVLALKHCLHSFLKQSDSLSTSLCPLSLVPLFFFAPACQLESLGRVLSISPTSPSCMSSHRWGKLSINRVGPPPTAESTTFYLPERPAGVDYNPSDITARSALISLFFALRWIRWIAIISIFLYIFMVVSFGCSVTLLCN